MLAPVNLRFAELIQEVGLTKNAFAQSLGKTASVVQHLIDGRNKPGYDLLCKVFEIYPNVSKDWLMEGQGPMLLTGAPKAAPAAAPATVPSVPAIALKKAAGAPTLFAAQIAEDAPETPAASAPQPAASPAVAPPAAPPIAAVEAAPPVAAPLVGAPAPVPAAAAAPAADVAIGAALQTQHLLHQLALAEMRNQHLLEQQHLLRQMLDMAQGR